MKRKLLFTIAIAIMAISLNSCREYYAVRQTGAIVGGRNTSYSKTYEFDKRLITAENPLETAEQVFYSHKWNISSESDNSVTFEFVESPITGETVSKTASGTARFNESADEIVMYMRLRGNYGFGTKKRADEFYEELAEALYGTNYGKSREN